MSKVSMLYRLSSSVGCGCQHCARKSSCMARLTLHVVLPCCIFALVCADLNVCGQGEGPSAFCNTRWVKQKSL